MSADAEEQRPGLRERKKAKTRAAIQEHALRLFREQGYDETTVEQICEEAEVSPSTFFRYFPTKEDVVLHDRYDPLLLAALVGQPPERTPIQAVREATRSVLGALSEEELEQERERGNLVVSVPALRARALDQLSVTMQTFAAVLAGRAGRDPDDLEVRNFTGALIGIMIAATLTAFERPDADYLELLEGALDHLEAGLPL